MHPLIGRVIDNRFQVVRLLGKGGMGAVFEAVQTKLDRRCVVKVLLPSAFEAPTAKPRFLREARLAARIRHPNVVDIVDTGTDADGLSYIVMEYLDGESLDKTLAREGALPWERARHIILQICSALEAAHACGIVHRDLKPGNCMRVTNRGDPDFIKLVDFGIAKALREADKQTKLTQNNVRIGTVDYMAYEQADAWEDCDHRVDVWATGVILYELVSSCLPFRGAHAGLAVQRLHAILHNEATPLTSRVDPASVPDQLPEIVHRALCKDRDARYQTITELREAIESLPRMVTRAARPAVAPPAGLSNDVTGPTEIHPAEVISVHSASIAEEVLSVVHPAVGAAELKPLAPAQISRRAPIISVSGWTSVIALALLAIALGAIFVTMIAIPLFQDILSSGVPPSGPLGPPPLTASPIAAPPATALASPPADAPPAITAPVDPLPDTLLPVDPPPVDPLPPAVTPRKPGTAKLARVLNPPGKPLTGPEACDRLRKRLAKKLGECVGTRSNPYQLRVELDANHLVTEVTIDPLLRRDPGYTCIAKEIRGWTIYMVDDKRSFDCPIPKPVPSPQISGQTD